MRQIGILRINQEQINRESMMNDFWRQFAQSIKDIKLKDDREI